MPPNNYHPGPRCACTECVRARRGPVSAGGRDDLYTQATIDSYERELAAAKADIANLHAMMDSASASDLVVRAQLAEAFAKRNASDAYAMGLQDACNGLLGLLQLLSARDDVPADVKLAMKASHRVVDAEAALAKNPRVKDSAQVDNCAAYSPGSTTSCPAGGAISSEKTCQGEGRHPSPATIQNDAYAERVQRMQKQYRETGTMATADVHAVLGDPVRGFTLRGDKTIVTGSGSVALDEPLTVASPRDMRVVDGWCALCCRTVVHIPTCPAADAPRTVPRPADFFADAPVPPGHPDKTRPVDWSNYNAPFCHHPEKCGPVGRCLREIACND